MILEYNLQFFAKDGPGGEKTEPATQKKLDDARKEGQVAKSKELGNAASLMGLFLLLQLTMQFMGNHFLHVFENIYTQIPEYIKFHNGYFPVATLDSIFKNALISMLLIMAPFLLVSFMIALVVDLVQVKWKPTLEPLKPKFNKLNPVSGIKRVISPNSLVELVKSIAKIVLVMVVVYQYLKDHLQELFLVYDLTLYQAVGNVGKMVTQMGLRISISYFIIAILDFAYQKWKFSNDMKMTKQEIKDEFKNQEGDPLIKSKQRQRMQEASRRRMMQKLPEADVVITNPTHYAVAIKYDPETFEAPYVIAKGADYLAAKIKEAAREHQIEIVENKPLARMLYANVEIGQTVPPELYQAVAEVLAFVYHLQGKV